MRYKEALYYELVGDWSQGWRAPALVSSATAGTNPKCTSSTVTLTRLRLSETTGQKMASSRLLGGEHRAIRMLDAPQPQLASDSGRVPITKGQEIVVVSS